METFKVKKWLTRKRIEDLFSTDNCRSFLGRVGMDIQRPSSLPGLPTMWIVNLKVESQVQKILSLEHADFPVPSMHKTS